MNIILAFLAWSTVPIILISLFCFDIVIIKKEKDSDKKRSAIAGILAGLVVFAVFVVNRLQYGIVLRLDFPSTGLLELLPLGFGVIVGFLFISFMRKLANKALGIITMSISATSTIALFIFLFSTDLQLHVLNAVLGYALGILLYIVLFSAKSKDYWSNW